MKYLILIVLIISSCSNIIGVDENKNIVESDGYTLINGTINIVGDSADIEIPESNYSGCTVEAYRLEGVVNREYVKCWAEVEIGHGSARLFVEESGSYAYMIKLWKAN